MKNEGESIALPLAKGSQATLVILECYGSGRLEALRIIISGHATASRSYGLLAATVWSAEHAHRARSSAKGMGRLAGSYREF